MQGRPFDHPALPPAFWTRPEVKKALERADFGALFRFVYQHGFSQTRISAATGLSQNRVSLIMRDRQKVIKLDLMTRIADGLGMPDHARIWLGIRPAQISPSAPDPALTDGDDDDLLRQVTSARYLDAAIIDVLQQETNAIRLLDRKLGAPAVADKLNAHIAHLDSSLHHCVSTAIRQGLALVLADAAALSGWQAIDMGNLTFAWHRFELATAAAREAGDEPLLAFAAGEQAYVLLDLGQSGPALDKVRAVHDLARHRVPALTRTWLFAAEAEMAAAVKDQHGCRDALDLAASHLSQPGDGVSLPYLALNDAHLASWRGNCLVQFGDAATITDLQTALTGMDGAFTRAEAGLRCDLAATLHASGERDEARHQLARATQLAKLTSSVRQRRRINVLNRVIGAAA
jgi:transcriptional regulator with XRE-family HTH domain